MEKKLKKAYEAYKNTFGDDFPTIPLAETREDEEIIEIIDECIRNNKDVYDSGYLYLDDDIKY